MYAKLGLVSNHYWPIRPMIWVDYQHFDNVNGVGWFNTSYKIGWFPINVTISYKIIIITCI